jgi:exopolysaccharide production protein ExoZ
MPLTQKINSIQFLRGLAALIVVIYHTAGYIKVNFSPVVFLDDFFNFGFAGVDLFFVISGFIILFTSKKYINNPESIGEYLKKRFVRIYPIYWIILSILFLLSWFIPFLLNKNVFKTEFPDNFSSYINTIFLLPKHLAINAASWTLSYELYFYLVFSLIILSKKLKFIPLLILAISFYNSIILNPNADFIKPTYFTFFFSGYNFEFMFGVLICQFYHKINFSKILSILFVFISVVIITQLGHNVGDFDTYKRIITFGMPSGLILLSLLNLEKNHGLRFSKFLIMLGDASYVLYLIHFPMMLLLNKIPVLLGYSFSINTEIYYSYFIIISIVITSIYIHKWVEKPLNKLILG